MKLFKKLTIIYFNKNKVLHLTKQQFPQHLLATAAPRYTGGLLVTTASFSFTDYFGILQTLG